MGAAPRSTDAIRRHMLLVCCVGKQEEVEIREV